MTGTFADNSVDDALNSITEILREGKTTIRKFVTDMLGNFFEQWSNDRLYNESDENVIEHINNSEKDYEFTENGNRWNKLAA